MSAQVKLEVEFAAVPEWLVFADISAQAVRVYAVLARAANYSTKRALVSHKWIAEHSRASVPTIRRALDELENLGAITITARMDKRGRASNLYVLKVTRPLLTGEQASLLMDEQSESLTDEQDPMLTGEQTSTETEAVLDKTAALRPRDEAWEAFCTETHVDWHELSEDRRAALNGMLGTLRRLTPDLSAAEIRGRAAEWRRRYPNTTLTPETLVRRWAELGRASSHRAARGLPPMSVIVSNPEAQEAYTTGDLDRMWAALDG